MEILWVRTAFDQSSQGFEAAFSYLEELTMCNESEFFFDADQEKIDMEAVKREVRRRAINGGRHLLFGMILIWPALKTAESISLIRLVMQIFSIHQGWEPIWFAKATRDNEQEKMHLLMFEEDTSGDRRTLRDPVREDVVRIAQALLSDNEEEKAGWLASSNIVI
jgi:hypothetical protein